MLFRSDELMSLGIFLQIVSQRILAKIDRALLLAVDFAQYVPQVSSISCAKQHLVENKPMDVKGSFAEGSFA